MNLELGQRVIAKRTTGVCEAGERGVVYEVYDREGYGGGGEGPGVSVIFEKGRYDGFSPDEAKLMLDPLEEECKFGRGYNFQNVGQLDKDFRRGLFTFKD